MEVEKKRCTAHGNLVRDTHTGAPTEEKLADGQLKDHFVLCPEDRAKGFVRPYRDSYLHIGIEGPKYPTVPVDEEFRAQRDYELDPKWVVYEEYPEGADRTGLGRYWTQEQLDKVGKGCGGSTKMGRSIAETYAAQPTYYGSTFCARCGDYFRVGRDGEFVWEDGTRVGT